MQGKKHPRGRQEEKLSITPQRMYILQENAETRQTLHGPVSLRRGSEQTTDTVVTLSATLTLRANHPHPQSTLTISSSLLSCLQLPFLEQAKILTEISQQVDPWARINCLACRLDGPESPGKPEHTRHPTGVALGSVSNIFYKDFKQQ